MENEERQNINMNINNGESFFAHQVSLNFSPTQFFIDFKNITPRVDERSKQPTIVVKHNVIMIEPFHLTKFHELLGQVINKYEEEFGKIEAPKQIKNLEKKQMKASKKNEKSKKIKIDDNAPAYFG